MPGDREGPLIVQGDHTLLLDADHPDHDAARDDIAPFAELVKSPEHIHTYRVTPLSLWNAASAGLSAEVALAALNRWSRYDLPQSVRFTIEDQIGRYGRIQLVRAEGGLRLVAEDHLLLEEIARRPAVSAHLAPDADPAAGWLPVRTLARGPLKQALLKLGHPVEDLAGYVPGAPLPVSLREATVAAGDRAPGGGRTDLADSERLEGRAPARCAGARGEPFALRAYQVAAADAFWAGGSARGGSGVVCLPCGAGKTLVGLAVMARASVRTLILCSSTTAAHQWMREILARTTLAAEAVGEYTGERKEVLPVTVSTYQMLTSRRDANGDFPHMRLLEEGDWGLIVYDEVHLLPAPVFRATAEIQARRRLGLTATLVREDQREDDVFALIGPKRYDTPWRDLERGGWIAPAECRELRLAMDREQYRAYAFAAGQAQFRLAAENPAKEALAERLVERHRGERILVIGHYLEQLRRLAERLRAPLLTGSTAQAERDRLFEAFRRGDETVLVVSRVANFAVDLPEASVAIEVSGLFGSRQEEAQRLGRLLRPKGDGRTARFYTLVSQDTREQEFARKRQLFLAEQGYRYAIEMAAES